MPNLKTHRLNPIKTGKKIGFLEIGMLLGAFLTTSWANGTHFSAQVNPDSLSLDETVELQLSLRIDETSQSDSQSPPSFEAPDFQKMGESSSLSIRSSYDSQAGGLKTIQEKRITHILRPLSTGRLKISHIRWKSAGHTWEAPDLFVEVTQTPSSPHQRPRSSHSQWDLFSDEGDWGLGLPWGGKPRKRHRQPAGPVTLKLYAKTDRKTYFKGEQVLVTYYLDHSVSITNLQIESLPLFSGFLKEELDVPTSGQTLPTQTIESNGSTYERTQLGRYAAYPLSTGQLSLDGLTVRLNYFAEKNFDPHSDDLSSFFGMIQPLLPQSWHGRSEPLSIQVLPLPTEGQPRSFTGGIGEFTVTSAVNRHQVKIHEPITWVIQIQGKGNLSLASPPTPSLGSQIEIYDSKKKKEITPLGVSTQTFEWLILPHQSGTLTLPSLEWGFFDPLEKRYYVKTTESIPLEVEPDPNQPLPSKPAAVPEKTQAQDSASPAPDAGPPPIISTLSWMKKGLGWILGVLSLGALCWGARLSFRTFQKSKTFSVYDLQKRWKSLRQEAHTFQRDAQPSQEAVVQFYQKLTKQLSEMLERRGPASLASLSRHDLRSALVESGEWNELQWDCLEQYLNFSEEVCFTRWEKTDPLFTSATQKALLWTQKLEELFTKKT